MEVIKVRHLGREVGWQGEGSGGRGRVDGWGLSK